MDPPCHATPPLTCPPTLKNDESESLRFEDDFRGFCCAEITLCEEGRALSFVGKDEKQCVGGHEEWPVSAYFFSLVHNQLARQPRTRLIFCVCAMGGWNLMTLLRGGKSSGAPQFWHGIGSLSAACIALK